jgi:hypothetical protein
MQGKKREMGEKRVLLLAIKGFLSQIAKFHDIIFE